MHNSSNRPWPAGRVLLAACVTAVAVVSCGSSSKSPSAAIPTAPASHGPATAQLVLDGDPTIDGALTAAKITCSEPALDGLELSVLTQPRDPKISTSVYVNASGVLVHVASGSGQSVHVRDFDGAGVTGYDPAHGTQLASTLRERPHTAGITPGSLPAVTGINGNIDCAGQRPGSSTLVFSGETGDGAISGTLDPVHVSCEPNALGPTVAISGVAKIGSERAMVNINGLPGTFIVTIAPRGGSSRVFVGNAEGASKPTKTGIHISGDAPEQDQGGGKNKLHVAGDAVCGSSS